MERITPANINEGRAGPDALPDNPGDVYADSANRSNHFDKAVRAKGGTAHLIANDIWGRDEKRRFGLASKSIVNRSSAFADGSRKSSQRGNAAICDVKVGPDGAVYAVTEQRGGGNPTIVRLTKG